jgi:hypothetical protein
MTDLAIEETSGVDHPAHLREGWLVMKSADGVEGALNAILKHGGGSHDQTSHGNWAGGGGGAGGGMSGSSGSGGSTSPSASGGSSSGWESSRSGQRWSRLMDRADKLDTSGRDSKHLGGARGPRYDRAVQRGVKRLMDAERALSRGRRGDTQRANRFLAQAKSNFDEAAMLNSNASDSAIADFRRREGEKLNKSADLQPIADELQVLKDKLSELRKSVDTDPNLGSKNAPSLKKENRMTPEEMREELDKAYGRIEELEKELEKAIFPSDDEDEMDKMDEEDMEEEFMKSAPAPVARAFAKAKEAARSALAKAAAAEAELTAQRESAADAEAIEKARGWDHLSLDAEEVGPMLRRLGEQNDELAKSVTALLDSINGQAESANIFAEIGKSATPVSLSGDAVARLTSMAKSLVDSGKAATIEQGFAEVAMSNPDLYTQYLTEKGA